MTSTSHATLEMCLHRAGKRRSDLQSDPSITAYRLFHGASDGVPGLYIDRYGPGCTLIRYADLAGELPDPALLGKLVLDAFEILGVNSVYDKPFVRDRSAVGGREDAVLTDPSPIAGAPLGDSILVREPAGQFEVHLHDGFSTGLFLDGRDTRRRVRELAAGGRVLNAFAYTCGFSVAAAIGQAAQTVSVDISAKALEWGRRNFEINHLPLDDHQFIRSEQFEYFNRARRQGRTFDLIVLDPPSFARTKRPKTLFSVVTDLQRLVTEALTVLAPGGSVLLSTNNRTRTVSWLSGQIAEAAAAAKRRFRVVDTPPLPLDFAADRDYAKTIIARFP